MCTVWPSENKQTVPYLPVFHRIQSGNSWRTPAWHDHRNPAGRLGWFRSTSELYCTWRIVVVATRPAPGWCWRSNLELRSQRHGADCDEDWLNCLVLATIHDRQNTETLADHTLYAPFSTTTNNEHNYNYITLLGTVFHTTFTKSMTPVFLSVV